MPSRFRHTASGLLGVWNAVPSALVPGAWRPFLHDIPSGRAGRASVPCGARGLNQGLDRRLGGRDNCRARPGLRRFGFDAAGRRRSMLEPKEASASRALASVVAQTPAPLISSPGCGHRRVPPRDRRAVVRTACIRRFASSQQAAGTALRPSVEREIGNMQAIPPRSGGGGIRTRERPRRPPTVFETVQWVALKLSEWDAHPVFKTSRAGQPFAWMVRFHRRSVARNAC
jgi:hypothetical protein